MNQFFENNEAFVIRDRRKTRQAVFFVCPYSSPDLRNCYGIADLSSYARAIKQKLQIC